MTLSLPVVRVLFGLWLAGVAAGTALLWRHDLAPGELAAAPVTWPKASAFARDEGRATLVLWLHPLCPCGRASLDELEQLLEGRERSLEAYVVLVTLEEDSAPEARGELETNSAEWADSALERRAADIAGVAVEHDPGGREARRFGAITSGQLLAYDSSGELVFRGGITPARGHAGDSPALLELESWLDSAVLPRPTAPVFGCRIPIANP